MVKIFVYSKILLLSSLLLVGCDAITSDNPRVFPQPNLPQSTLFVGKDRVPCLVEVADQKHQIQTGLMGRESLPLGMGMFFILPKPARVGFWMKNTNLDLSIAYIDSGLVIQEIYDLNPLSEALVISKTDNILYALEVPKGWFESNHIKVGDLIYFQ